MIIICDHIVSPANMGSIFRLADAFGVSEIIFCGNQPDITSSRLRKTARNTESMVRFRESEDLAKTLTQLHEDNFTSVAIEITDDSIAIQKMNFSSIENIVIIVGSERNGISNTTLKMVHHTAHISMFGTNSSMNVAQAAGIALYEITRV